MSRNKRKPTCWNVFESSLQGDQPYVRLSANMMQSPAWKDMSIYARYLYGEIKLAWAGKDPNAIQFPFSKGEKLMNYRTFSQALDELIKHGFISVSFQGKWQRKPSLYALSAQWQMWPNIKTTARVYVLTDAQREMIDNK